MFKSCSNSLIKQFILTDKVQLLNTAQLYRSRKMLLQLMKTEHGKFYFAYTVNNLFLTNIK